MEIIRFSASLVPSAEGSGDELSAAEANAVLMRVSSEMSRMVMNLNSED